MKFCDTCGITNLVMNIRFRADQHNNHRCAKCCANFGENLILTNTIFTSVFYEHLKPYILEALLKFERNPHKTRITKKLYNKTIKFYKKVEKNEK